MNLAGTTVLLTGGSGFIGRNLLSSPLSKNYRILAPRHAELDLGDEVAVRSYIRYNRVSAVIHSAVKPAHRAASDTSDVLRANLRYFYALSRNQDVLEKILVLGSGSVYDHRFYKEGLAEEDFDASVPADDLGLFKYAINQSIQPGGKVYDLRVFGIFGPHEDYRIRFPSNMICKALLRVPMTMRQDRLFDFIHVDDLAPVIDWVLSGEPVHRAYNVTSGKPVHLFELAESIREWTGTSSSIQVESAGVGVPYTGSNLRLVSENPNLTFRPAVEGIGPLIDWYRDQLPSLDHSVFLKDF